MINITSTIIPETASASNKRNYIIGGVLFLAAIGVVVLAESISTKKNSSTKK